MDDYQRLAVAQFFEPLPTLSAELCHQFILDHIVPALLPNTSTSTTTGKIEVRSSPFQGSMSYTAILHIHLAHANYRRVVQFRNKKQDLSAVSEASRIHGLIVPMVTYQAVCEGLFVYTSPFAEGTPYIRVLMSSEDLKLPLWKKMATVMDLADLVTRGARANNNISDTAIVELTSTIEKIRHAVNNYTFRNTSVKNSISACINTVLSQLQLRNFAALPVTLTYQDLAPFNYLINPSTGRVEAVLGWDDVLYLPVGSNFHFVDNIFGFMTPKGWQDMEDRHSLGTAFYNCALASLAAQGHKGVTKEQLELQKAIGMLLYGVERLLKFKDERSELYLDGYLRGLSFMKEPILSPNSNDPLRRFHAGRCMEDS